jgi:hypothetical protein
MNLERSYFVCFSINLVFQNLDFYVQRGIVLNFDFCYTFLTSLLGD